MNAPSSPETARPPLRVAVLASGRGSNLQALHRAQTEGRLPIALVGVFSDQPGSGALAYACAHGLPAEAVSPSDFADRETFDLALMRALAAARPELLICAGFMRIISKAGIRAAPCPMINIHPSLLPKFPGLHTHARALAAGEREHGASVHLVDEVLDGGRVLARARVPVHAGEDPSQLAERVLRREHPLLIATVRAIADGRIRLQDDASPRVSWLSDDDLDLE